MLTKHQSIEEADGRNYLPTTRIDHGNGYEEFRHHDRTEWRLNGQWHRIDGPSIAHTACGSKYWHLYGKLHRVDGPAFERTDGRTYWCLNGQYHRVDGPAIEYEDGSKYWWVRNEDISTEVEQWIVENELPDYRKWTAVQKVMFVLRWG